MNEKVSEGQCNMAASPDPAGATPEWSFFTIHATVLFLVARNPSLTRGELADMTGLTLRRVQQILTDLTRAGYLVTVVTEGREYLALPTAPLHYPTGGKATLAELLRLAMPRSRVTRLRRRLAELQKQPNHSAPPPDDAGDEPLE